jgi:hypothetical protein
MAEGDLGKDEGNCGVSSPMVKNQIIKQHGKMQKRNL